MPIVKLDHLVSRTKSNKVVRKINNKTYFYVVTEGLNYPCRGIYSSFNKALKAIKTFMKETPEDEWAPLKREDTSSRINAVIELYNTSVMGFRRRLPVTFKIIGSFLDYKTLVDTAS